MRMERHQANAAAWSWMLAQHETIDRVWYPGLETHPNHKVAARSDARTSAAW